ncbi:SDR family NAD(P)-dependent oxidoreductase [Gordonia liuliyuniae]|uniref:SDR family NAD(P)-dependent oxidoreductase n=1 Tax=Gordonia liuliyuniae TaxID=2911517 RepID=A0ABS9IY30_9ACTN|nr:SDR family NAD(P)-dependent oxidoreductase [Gordonia liuliyuniae]MCF8590473.1 SDR family NAD(P)-dependent oxidoreductase [Gordonia liuliyuniae]
MFGLHSIQSVVSATGDFVLNPSRGLTDLRHVGRHLLSGGTHDDDLSGRTIVVTGASSGIGDAAARLLASYGAELVLVARGIDGLQKTLDDITAAGGTAHLLTANLADPDDARRLATEILETFGAPDVLVNNAGRSIRRTALDTVDRFHDYERTMAVNYFGPVALTLGLLPAMLDAGRGQIVNVVTWGVHAGSMPKFGAYHASKSALAAFGRSLDSECANTGVCVTQVGFPLVRTPMIAPTESYDDAPALTPEEAGEWILRAVQERPAQLYPRYASILRAVGDVSPRSVGRIIGRLGI